MTEIPTESSRQKEKRAMCVKSSPAFPGCGPMDEPPDPQAAAVSPAGVVVQWASPHGCKTSLDSSRGLVTCQW